MRISIKESGGAAFFPGLAKPRTVELDSLPEPDQQELRQLIEAADFSSCRKVPIPSLATQAGCITP